MGTALGLTALVVEETERDLAGRGIVEVFPTWIHAFDQPELPLAVPALQSFLALNGFGDAGVVLVLHELAHAIPRGETGD
jgi:hypothetical protein